LLDNANHSNSHLKKIKGRIMLKNAPGIKTFFKVALQIILAILTCAVVSLVMRFTAVPLIVSSIEMSDIQVHAVKGILSLVAFSLGYWIYVKFYEKRQTVEFSFTGLNMLFSTLFGATIILLTILPLFSLGYYQIETYQTFDEVFFAIIGLSTQATFGAILFTGIIFRLIELQIGTKYSLLSLSVLLGLLNIIVDGPNLMVLISSILVSALWFSIYVLSRNLWVVGLAHSAWLCAVFATGILDEHWRDSAPIVSNYSGSILITGGEFGPEHSIVTIVIVSICLFLILRLANLRGMFVKT